MDELNSLDDLGVTDDIVQTLAPFVTPETKHNIYGVLDGLEGKRLEYSPTFLFGRRKKKDDYVEDVVSFHSLQELIPANRMFYTPIRYIGPYLHTYASGYSLLKNHLGRKHQEYEVKSEEADVHINPVGVLPILRPKYPSGEEICDLAIIRYFTNGAIVIDLCEMYVPFRTQRFDPSRKAREFQGEEDYIARILYIDQWLDTEEVGLERVSTNASNKKKQIMMRKYNEKIVKQQFATFLEVRERTIELRHHMFIMDPLMYGVSCQNDYICPVSIMREHLQQSLQEEVQSLYDYIWYGYIPCIISPLDGDIRRDIEFFGFRPLPGITKADGQSLMAFYTILIGGSKSADCQCLSTEQGKYLR